MSTRTVHHEDGRVEICREPSAGDSGMASSSDAVAFESSIVWLEDINPLRFVRARTVRNCKKRDGDIHVSGDGRLIGYAKLRSDAPTDPATGGFVRRVFYLRKWDKPATTDDGNIPEDAVDPNSVLPGVAGQLAVKQQELTRERPSTNSFGSNHNGKESADDEVVDWLGQSAGPGFANLRPLSGDDGGEPRQSPDDTESSIDFSDYGLKPISLREQAVTQSFGELVPQHRGDPIPLTKEELSIGRKADCDIEIHGSNISGIHCELSLIDGYWYVRDLESRNGTRVNDVRVTGEPKRIEPNDLLWISSLSFLVSYDPYRLGASK